MKRRSIFDGAMKGLGVLTAGLLLAGCAAGGGSVADPSGSGVPAAPGDRVDGGVIEYAHDQEPACLQGGWTHNSFLARQYLDSLVAETEDHGVAPWLAESWAVSPDQLVWTFELKSGVQFSDGTPFDAEAVRATFEYYRAPETSNGLFNSYLGEFFDHSEVVDPLTYRLHLKKPYSPLLSVLAQSAYGIQSPVALARGPEANCSNPIGTGPFVIEKWDRGQSITFTKNEAYNSAPATAKHQGPAYVDKLVWKFLKDNTVRFGSLTSGESDAISAIPPGDWATAQDSYQILHNIVPGRGLSLTFNTSRAPFDDERVRQAFAYSADRENSVAAAFNGVLPYTGNGALSPSSPDFDESVADAYPYDPDKASKLLDEAGWTEKNADGFRTKDGQELGVDIVYPAGAIVSSEGQTVLQNVQEQAKSVGFAVNLVPVTQSDFFAGKIASPDAYDIYVVYWSSPTPAVMYLNFRQDLPDRPTPHNNAYYNDPELESILAEAIATTDPEVQAKLYSQAQQIVSDKAVAVGMYPQDLSLAVDPALHDVWIAGGVGEPVFHDAYFVE
nr:ABC transporter substrate-binding protein [Rhodococcus sp. 06-621-2]